MRRGSFFIVVLALALPMGCVTPSIPIPPPNPTDMTFDLTTTGAITSAVFTYPSTNAYVDSTLYVYDNANGKGVFQRANADGSLGPTLALPAMPGDPVVVSITSNAQETVSTCVVLQQGLQNPNAQCP